MNRLWTTWRTRIGCFKQIENAISLIIGRLSLVPSNFNNHKLSKYTLETPISLRFEHICHSTWRQCVAALSVFKTTPAMLLKLCRCHKGFFPSSSLKHCQRHNRPRVMVLVWWWWWWTKCPPPTRFIRTYPTHCNNKYLCYNFSLSL
jgi:hypothetical protein